MTDHAPGVGGDCPAAGGMAGKAIDVAAAVVFRDGHVLITQRRPGDHLGGLWEFPGGKREPGETFEACLQRELWEELGIEVEVGEWLDSVTHAYPEKTVHLRFYRCAWRRHEPRALGCHAWVWVTAAQLAQYPFPTHEPRALGCHAWVWVTAAQLAQYPFPPADATLLEKLRTSAELWGG